MVVLAKKQLLGLLTMKAVRMSLILVIGCTGSLQNSDSIKCCRRRCLNTRTVGGISPGFSGPHPYLCSTGGRTYCKEKMPYTLSMCMVKASRSPALWRVHSIPCASASEGRPLHQLHCCWEMSHCCCHWLEQLLLRLAASLCQAAQRQRTAR